MKTTNSKTLKNGNGLRIVKLDNGLYALIKTDRKGNDFYEMVADLWIVQGHYYDWS